MNLVRRSRNQGSARLPIGRFRGASQSKTHDQESCAPVAQDFLAAREHLGLLLCRDPNRLRCSGFSLHSNSLTCSRAARKSCATAQKPVASPPVGFVIILPTSFCPK